MYNNIGVWSGSGSWCWYLQRGRSRNMNDTIRRCHHKPCPLPQGPRHRRLIHPIVSPHFGSSTRLVPTHMLKSPPRHPHIHQRSNQVQIQQRLSTVPLPSPPLPGRSPLRCTIDSVHGIRVNRNCPATTDIPPPAQSLQQCHQFRPLVCRRLSRQPCRFISQRLSPCRPRPVRPCPSRHRPTCSISPTCAITKDRRHSTP
jgi:hypothetical protein